MASYRIKWKGREAGPYTESQLRTMLASREIRNLHEVEVDGEWITVRKFFKIRDQRNPDSTNEAAEPVLTQPEARHAPVPPETASATPDIPDLPHESLTGPATGDLKPVTNALNQEAEDALILKPQRNSSESATSKPDLPKPDISENVIRQTRAGEFLVHAGFWYRLLAAVVDITLVLVLPAVILSRLFSIEIEASDPAGFIEKLVGLGFLGAALTALHAILVWIYFAWMESSRRRGTVGKMVFGLVVTDELGNPVTFQRASVRFFSKALSALILFAGFFLAAFTRRKQGLHDLISRCTVNHSLPLSRLLRRTAQHRTP